MKLGLLYTIIQCILALLLLWLAIYELRKEFRKKTNVAKREASIIKKILIGIAVTTIIVQVIAYIDANQSQSELNSKLDTVNIQNAVLKAELAATKKTMLEQINSSEANLALQASANALKASYNTQKSAEWLSNYINGSDIPPRFAAVNASIEHSFVLENLDTLRANIDAFCINYDEIILCKRDQDRVDRKCYQNNMLPITWSYILAKKQIPFTLPKYNPNKNKSRYTIHITMTKSKYIIQVIFIAMDNNSTLVNSRTLKKEKNEYKIYSVDKSPIKIDWEKEFYLPHDEKWGDL